MDKLKTTPFIPRLHPVVATLREIGKFHTKKTPFSAQSLHKAIWHSFSQNEWSISLNEKLPNESEVEDILSQLTLLNLLPNYAQEGSNFKFKEEKSAALDCSKIKAGDSVIFKKNRTVLGEGGIVVENKTNENQLIVDLNNTRCSRLYFQYSEIESYTTPANPISAKIQIYLETRSRPTLKQIQSMLRIPGLTCEEIKKNGFSERRIHGFGP